MLPHPLAKGRDTPDSLILNGEGEPVPPQREPTPTEPSSTKLREPRIKLANVREKLMLLRTGKARSTHTGMDMADVIEEAQQNRSAVLDDFAAASELIQNLSIPPANRRAVHLREITELGRRIQFPSSWFSSERKQAIIWYHAVQNLKLVQFDAGDVIFKEGQLADRAFWFLGDKEFNRRVKQSADSRSTSPSSTPSHSKLQQAANVATYHKQGAPSAAQPNIAIWQGVGYEALVSAQQAYTSTVVASYKGSAAVLSRHDYTAIKSMLQSTSFESLKGINLMLKAKQERTQQELKDLAAVLSVFDMFNTMEESVRQEAAHLVEYMYCPEEFILYEEGDKVDYSYVILQGSVRLSKKDGTAETKTTGQQFGSLVQLVHGKKKRPFSAKTETPCELAIMSRTVYSRVLQKHLQDVMQARAELLKSLANLDDNSSSLQRIASYCADEVYPAGSAIVQPSNFPYKVLIIMDGEAKEIWDPDDVNNLPTPIDSIENARPLRNYQPQRRLATRTREKKKKHGSSAAASGPDAGGSESAFPTAPGPRRHAIEVAKLGKGDIVNGLCLLGKTPQFHVIAHTKVKALSFETETCEAALGPQLYSRVCKLVQAKHNWCQDRVLRSLAVRKALGTNSILTKESADPALRASAMAHFLDHYVPQDMQDASSTSAKAKKGAKPGSVSPAPHDLAAREDGEDAQLAPEFSGIKSLLVRGKEPPPPPSVSPWHGNSCPPHHTNFREAVARASAEAAAACDAIMGSSAAVPGMQAPSIMQELMTPNDAGDHLFSKLHEEPWTGQPPSGWPSAEPLFAGQLCTTFLDLQTARTLRSVYARYKPPSHKSKGTSRLSTPPKRQSSSPRPLSQPSQDSQHAADGRSASQFSSPATGTQQAERQSSPRTASRGLVDSDTSPPPAHGVNRGSLPPVLLPGLQGAGTSAQEDAARGGGVGGSKVAIGQRGMGSDVDTQRHAKGDLSKSWAAGMGAGGRVESGLKGWNTVHSSMDAAAVAEAQNASSAVDWQQGGRHAGHPDLMVNKDSLPQLPNAPNLMLVSENLKQRMLQQRATSSATAQYVRKRTATLVSHDTSPDLKHQAAPSSKASSPEAHLSVPPAHEASQEGGVSGSAHHSSPLPSLPPQSYSSPGAPPPTSAAGVLNHHQPPAHRRSQAALGASLLKAPGGGSATALGHLGPGFDDEGVIILPHMMSIYDGLLDNERGFLKHANANANTHARPPHARLKSQPPPASAFQYQTFVVDPRKGASDDEEKQDGEEEDPASLLSPRSLRAMCVLHVAKQDSVRTTVCHQISGSCVVSG